MKDLLGVKKFLREVEINGLVRLVHNDAYLLTTRDNEMPVITVAYEPIDRTFNFDTPEVLRLGIIKDLNQIGYPIRLRLRHIFEKDLERKISEYKATKPSPNSFCLTGQNPNACVNLSDRRICGIKYILSLYRISE